MKGTILHKMMEILAKQKLCEQEGKPFNTIEDECIDSSKLTYDIRSAENLDFVFNSVYDKLTSESDLNFTDKERRQIYKWLQTATTYLNGSFNPLVKDVVSPECHFEIEIPDDWASYAYTLPNGEIAAGQLKIRGIIDLVSRIDDKTYEILDYKSGACKSWVTFKEKTLQDIQNDIQLQIYHLAAHYLYPDIENVILCMYYLAFDKPFTVSLDKEVTKLTLDRVCRQFNRIRNCKNPRCSNTFFCSKICYWNKCPHPSGVSQCQFYRNELQRLGMDETIRRYKVEKI